MTINTVGSTAPASPVGSGQRPHHHDRAKLLEPAAKALGMSTGDLETELKAGQSLSDVASGQGVSQDDLVAAIAAELKTHKPDGAPALSDAQATQMATAIVQRKPGEGRGAGAAAPPAPATAQGNLATLAATLGTDPSALTEKLMWGDTSDIGRSTPWDAGRDAPTSGLLVDDHA